MRVDTHVWQFGVDYPGAAGSDDSKLPLRSVMVKAWDEIYWMSTFDPHAAAISGPAAIAKLVKTYNAQGIELLLWCVPKGRNVSRMLALSKACIDVPGVKGLVMDVEPFKGFCAGDCNYLATTFMKQLRAARPKAWLGVTYDPRPQHWGPSGTSEWLKYANAGLPMMYWESFKTNVQPWPDPAVSVKQAYSDLRKTLAPGRNIEYFPIMQGNTAAARMTAGINAAVDVGSIRVSTWRRGVVPVATWSAIRAIPEPQPPDPPTDPCLDVKRQLAACHTTVDDLQARIAAKDARLGDYEQMIGQLEARVKSLINELAACKAEQVDLEKVRDAVKALRDFITGL